MFGITSFIKLEVLLKGVFLKALIISFKIMCLCLQKNEELLRNSSSKSVSYMIRRGVKG
jgi:hypothetical protein